MDDRKQQTIITEVAQLITDAQDMKGSQPLGGASFVNFSTKSAFAYDYSYNQSVFKRAFKVRFTHTDPGKYHIINLAAFFRLNNGNVMAAPYTTNVNREAQLDVVPDTFAAGYNEWTITTENFNQPYPGISYDFYLKLFFKGTSPGTFTITPIWP